MESNLKRSRNVSSDGIGVKTSLHSLEVDRVKFVLTAYIRERIQKIEKRPSYYLQVCQKFVVFFLIYNRIRHILNCCQKVSENSQLA